MAAAGAREPEQEQVLLSVADEVRGEVGAPGAILGVLFPDGKSVVVASGVADVASSRPMSAGDAFFLGSISRGGGGASEWTLAPRGLSEIHL